MSVKKSKLFVNVVLVAAALALVVGFQVLRDSGAVQAKPAPKEFICHAAGPDPTQYVCIHPNSNGGTNNGETNNGNGGHFEEDTGLPKPGHAFDILVDSCEECPGEAEPSPTPTPSPK